MMRYEMEASYILEEFPISDQRRPPIITLPEYRKQHNITEWRTDHTEQFEK
jgi:hypothetical protein